MASKKTHWRYAIPHETGRWIRQCASSRTAVYKNSVCGSTIAILPRSGGGYLIALNEIECEVVSAGDKRGVYRALKNMPHSGAILTAAKWRCDLEEGVDVWESEQQEAA